jgi:DNA-binding IscR family transcriptional regulator
MKISQKGLYALQALISLADRYDGKIATRIHDIASADGLPEKQYTVLELDFLRGLGAPHGLVHVRL